MTDPIFQITPETIQAVGEFSINWSLFEKYYCKCFCNPKVIDEIDFSPYHEKIIPMIPKFKTSLAAWFEYQNKEINDEGVKDILYTEKNEGSDYRTRIVSFLTSDSTSVVDCMLCVERLRNNLLHGEKEAFELNRQRELIETATSILYVLTNWSACMNAYYLAVKKSDGGTQAP